MGGNVKVTEVFLFLLCIHIYPGPPKTQVGPRDDHVTGPLSDSLPFYVNYIIQMEISFSHISH